MATKFKWKVKTNPQEASAGDEVKRCTFTFKYDMPARILAVLRERNLDRYMRGTNIIALIDITDSGRLKVELRSGYFGDRVWDETKATRYVATLLGELNQLFADPDVAYLMSKSWFSEKNNGKNFIDEALSKDGLSPKTRARFNEQFRTYREEADEFVKFTYGLVRSMTKEIGDLK